MPDPFADPTTKPVESTKVESVSVGGIPIVRGRYQLPHPETGKLRTWQRVTNFIGALEDGYALRQWEGRRIVYGMGREPKLQNAAEGLALCGEADDYRDELTALAEEAKALAGANDGASLGTELHRWTEHMDRGGYLNDVPDTLRLDVSTYTGGMFMRDIRVVPELIERTVCVPWRNGGVVGTFDRLVTSGTRLCTTCPEDVLYIFDLKTGVKELQYGQLKTTMQMALYAEGAQAHGVWNVAGQGWVWPFSGSQIVCQHVGILAHLPANQGAALTFYRMPLGQGRDACFLAELVIAARKTGKNLAAPL